VQVAAAAAVVTMAAIPAPVPEVLVEVAEVTAVPALLILAAVAVGLISFRIQVSRQAAVVDQALSSFAIQTHTQLEPLQVLQPLQQVAGLRFMCLTVPARLFGTHKYGAFCTT
jgi:hypothetical protein